MSLRENIVGFVIQNALICEELFHYDQKMNTLEGCVEFSEEAHITKREVCLNNVTSFCLNLYSVCRDKTKSELCKPAYFTDNDPKTEERVDSEKWIITMKILTVIVKV